MAVDVAQLADASLGKGFGHGFHIDADAPLVMHGDARVFFAGLGQHFVGLLAIDAQGFFNVDVGTVFEDAQRQGVVEFRASGNGDDVGLVLAHHLV